MNYLDSNFIAALHFNIVGQTEVAEKFVRKASLPFLASSLGELECRRAFILRAGHGKSENWRQFQDKLDAGVWVRFPMQWDRVAAKAVDLIEKHGAALNCGTLDTLHVALAQIAGCTWFLSFDTNSNARVLAASVRLKVYPDLTPQEKGKVIH